MTELSSWLAAMAAMAGAAAPSAAEPVTPAEAQVVCGTREVIVTQLEHKYGETRRSIGLQQGRAVVEVFASDQTGSWTILVTGTDGKSCLLAAGEAFEALEAIKASTPS